MEAESEGCGTNVVLTPTEACSLTSMDCLELGSLPGFPPGRKPLEGSGDPRVPPGSLAPLSSSHAWPLGAFLSKAGCPDLDVLAGLSEVQLLRLPPSPVAAGPAVVFSCFALWTGAWNPDLLTAPVSHSAAVWPVESTHSRRTPRARDSWRWERGDSGWTDQRSRGCGTFHASPARGGWGDYMGWGEATGLFWEVC